MKVRKIKNKKLVKKTLYAILLMLIGAYLHKVSTPNIKANWNADNTPYVLTRPLSKTDVSSQKKYIAEIEAINSVDIIPQVSGYLEEIHFENGSHINKGDNIFTIEQTEYLAEVEKITAEVKRLQKHYDRISTLNQKKYASDSEIDLAESNLKQAQASLEADNTSNVCSGANIV